MKRFLVVVLFSILFAMLIIPCSAATMVNVYVNDEFVDSEQQAMIVNGRTLVPLRAICEALKCTVEWENSTRTIQIQNKVTIVSLQIDNYLMTKVDREDPDNPYTVQLDVPPILYKNTTMVPVRAIAEALYAVVGWNGNQKRVDITLEFDTIGSFKNGKAVVSKDGKYGLINEKREVVVPLKYDDAKWNYSKGLMWVELDGKEGYVDTRGEIVIPIIYEQIRSFSEGNAVVLSWVGMSLRYGVVNDKGEQIVSFDEYDYIDKFFEGRAKVKSRAKYHRRGFIDGDGVLVIPMIYDDVEDFSEGVALALKDNTLFYIDPYGNVAITPEVPVHSAESFHEGLAAVERNGKWGYIDKSGKIVIPMIYDDKTHFVNGKASVVKGDEEFWIDKSGNRID